MAETAEKPRIRKDAQSICFDIAQFQVILKNLNLYGDTQSGYRLLNTAMRRANNRKSTIADNLGKNLLFEAEEGKSYEIRYGRFIVRSIEFEEGSLKIKATAAFVAVFSLVTGVSQYPDIKKGYMELRRDILFAAEYLRSRDRVERFNPTREVTVTNFSGVSKKLEPIEDFYEFSESEDEQYESLIFPLAGPLKPSQIEDTNFFIITEKEFIESVRNSITAAESGRQSN